MKNVGFFFPSRIYLMLIGFILSLDYLGPLFSHEATVKIITSFILFIFLCFLETTTFRKITASFLLLSLGIMLPHTVMYTSSMSISMLLVYLYCFDIKKRNIIYCTILTVVFFAISLLHNVIPIIFNIIEIMSCSITKAISFGTPLGCQGSIFIPFIATIFSLLVYLFHEKSNRKIILTNILIITIIYIIFVNFNVFILSHYPVVGLFFIPAEVVIITIFVHSSVLSRDSILYVHFQEQQKLLNKVAPIIAVLFIVSIVSLLNFSILSKAPFRTKNISIVSADVPFVNADQKISRENTIGFGNTPFIFSGFKSYLELIGHNVTVLDRLSNVDYNQTDVIILIHYNSNSTQEVINSVKAFVNSGGVVIAFNDHNNLFNARNETNKLLSFSGIEINDDISDNIIKNSGIVWQNSLYEFHSSPVITQLKSSSELNLGVWGGASVKATNLFATPLIIAKNGISDPSLLTPNKNGEYMGNRSFDYKDGYGNIPLGYAINYGAGSVVVFGDASYIQVPQSMYNWKLLYNIININNQKIFPEKIQILFTSFLLSIFVYFLYLLPHLLNVRKKMFLLILSGTIITLFSSYFINEYVIYLNAESNFRNIKKQYNVIDNSSENYFSTDLTKSNSVGGLGYISMTQNQPVFLLDTLYYKENINKFIIINPCKKVDVDLIDVLLAKGTDVLIISGKTYSHNITDIMKKYEINFGDSFLGPIPWKNPMIPNSNLSLNDKPEFKEAWNLDYNSNTTSPLFEYEGYVPATCTKTDGGNLYIISDSRFIDDNNLEGEFEGKIGNIKFLENIFNK